MAVFYYLLFINIRLIILDYKDNIKIYILPI